MYFTYANNQRSILDLVLDFLQQLCDILQTNQCWGRRNFAWKTGFGWQIELISAQRQTSEHKKTLDARSEL